MVFGRVPYYLRQLQNRLSLAQNITALCLNPQAPLRDEAKRLLDSTLTDKPVYYRVLAELGKTKHGLSRKRTRRGTRNQRRTGIHLPYYSVSKSVAI